MAQRQIGPFVIEGQLGVGGMGVVYLATYTATGKKVALKVLPPEISADVRLVRRFEREIDILKRLNHPNIVKYYGGGSTNQQRWYAMELIDGGSLLDVLRKRKVLNCEQAVQVGIQLCAALEHSHNAGIIHRDLKPANLFLSRKGRMKLGDFGIARDTEATALTAAGKTVGTYAYMAPEQIHGNHAISRKTDLYAVGCLLMELLTGRTPFEGSNPAEMLMQHVDSDAPLVREVHNVTGQPTACPIALEKLIERLLEKDPNERPHDALAVHTELTQILAALKAPQVEASPAAMAAAGVSASRTIDPETGLPKAKKKKKKKKEYAEFYEQGWFLGICLAVVVGIAIWLMLPAGEARTFQLAEEAWKSRDEITQRDGRTRYMLPYLQRFPDGDHHEIVQEWADSIMADILEAQASRIGRAARQPRNDIEAAFIGALTAEQDSQRNPLEAIEMFHSMLERLKPAVPAGNGDASTTTPQVVLDNFAEDDVANTQAAAEPRFWQILTERHLVALRTQFLKAENRDLLVHERMLTADQLIADDRLPAARDIWYHFREVFYGEREVDAYLVYCQHRLNNERTELPAAPKSDDDAATPPENVSSE